jgi:hypothetical protein
MNELFKELADNFTFMAMVQEVKDAARVSAEQGKNGLWYARIDAYYEDTLVHSMAETPSKYTSAEEAEDVGQRIVSECLNLPPLLDRKTPPPGVPGFLEYAALRRGIPKAAERVWNTTKPRDRHKTFEGLHPMTYGASWDELTPEDRKAAVEAAKKGPE